MRRTILALALLLLASPAAAQESLPYGFPTPLTTTGNDINLWERTYLFSPTGPIPSIVAKGGVAVSSATWILNSIPLTWSDPVVVSESARNAQLTTSSTSVSGWLVSAVIDVDYAGRIKIVTTVTRTGGTPAAFNLQYLTVIPTADSGRWLVKHVDYDPATFNVDKATLQNGHGLYPAEGTSHSFVPTMTVSSYDRGVEFIWESDAAWTPADKTGVTPITTTTSGASRWVVVTPVDASEPITLDTDETWTDKLLLFGLPMRPPTPNSFAFHNGSASHKASNWIAGTGKRYFAALFSSSEPSLSDEHVEIYNGQPRPRLHQPYQQLHADNQASAPVYDILPYGALQKAPSVHPLTYAREAQWAANDLRDTSWSPSHQPARLWANYTHMDREGNPYVCATTGTCPNANDTWISYHAGCSEDYWTWRRSEDVRTIGDKRYQMGGLYYDFGSLSRSCSWGTSEHPLTVISSGTATGGTAQQLQNSGAGWTPGLYNDHFVILRPGEPNEERRRISSNTETQLIINSGTRAWYDTPANGDAYQILQLGPQVWPYEWMYDYYKRLWESVKAIDDQKIIVAHVNGSPRSLGAFTSVQLLGESLNVAFGTNTAENISGCEGGCTDGTDVCTPYDSVTATDGGYCPDYFALNPEWLDSIMWPRVGGTTMLLPQVKRAVDAEERFWQNNLYAASWAAGLPVSFSNMGAYFGDYRALENAFELFGSRLDTDLIVTPDANRGDTTTITHGLRATVWGRPTDAPCDVGTCTYPAMLVLVNPTSADVTDGTVKINDRASLGIPGVVNEWERWDPTTMPARPGGTGNISVQDGLDMWSAAEGFCTAGPEIQGITVPAKSFVLYLLGDGGAAESASCATGGDTLLSEDFEALSAGTEITDWQETGVNNALTENDALFGIVDESGNNVVQTTAFPGNNAHVHYQGAGAELWANYELTGTMRTSETSGSTGVGVTWYSDYPDSDTYYRLRTFAGANFVLSSHPETGLFDCDNPDTGVAPVADTTYAFRVRTENYPTENAIFLKIWDAAGSEPSEWQMTCTDPRESRPTEGAVGMWSYAIAGPGTVNTWDDFEATSIVSSFVPECSDGIDNDSDGDIDHPADADCESPADNSEAEVTLDPTLVVSPDTLSVEAEAAGADFATQQLALTNPGDEFSECEYTCSLHASDDIGGEVGTDWIQVSGSGTLPFTDPSGPGPEEFCTVDGAGSGECSEGTYEATVRVACTGASNTPQDVPVTLDCVGAIPPTVDAGPNQSVPGGGTIQLDGSITNPADGPLWTFTAGTCSGFSPSNAVLNPTFTMTDDPQSCTAQLCDGVICASVTVTVPVPPASSACADGPQSVLTTENGITFTLDEAFDCAQNIDGTYTIFDDGAGPLPGNGVVVTHIDPPYTGNGRDGYQIVEVIQAATVGDPTIQSLDNRQCQRLPSTRCSFVQPPSLPLPIPVERSLVKIISNNESSSCTNPGTTRCVDTATALTVVAEDLIPGCTNRFRPSSVGTVKKQFCADSLMSDIASDLPDLALVGDQGPWTLAYANNQILKTPGTIFGVPDSNHDTITNTFQPLDAVVDHSADQQTSIQTGYGAQSANTYTAAIARTLQTGADADKYPVVWKMIQVGIDIWGMMNAGKRYYAAGGIHQGRLLPVLYAWHFLGDNDLLNKMGSQDFQENGYTYHSSINDEPLFGRNASCISDESQVSSKKSSRWCAGNVNDIRDGGHKKFGTCGISTTTKQPTKLEQIGSTCWSMTSYQGMIASYYGALVVAQQLSLEDEWDYPAFFETIGKYLSPPWNGASPNYSSPYLEDFAMTYATRPQCNDGIDNDTDGDIDFPEDSGCTSASDTTE